jgi:hypothetical protein
MERVQRPEAASGGRSGAKGRGAPKHAASGSGRGSWHRCASEEDGSWRRHVSGTFGNDLVDGTGFENIDYIIKLLDDTCDRCVVGGCGLCDEHSLPLKPALTLHPG